VVLHVEDLRPGAHHVRRQRRIVRQHVDVLGAQRERAALAEQGGGEPAVDHVRATDETATKAVRGRM